MTHQAILAMLTLAAACGAEATTYQVTEVPSRCGYSTPSINRFGMVAGTAARHDELRPFIFEDGALRVIETGTHFIGWGINDKGDVVGGCETRKKYRHACLWNGIEVRDLGALGANKNASVAYGVNNLRQVVGTSMVGNFSTDVAFVYRHGVMTDLGALGGEEANAQAINEAGHVVGSADLPNGLGKHAFLFDGVEMRDLGALPGASGSMAVALNDADDAVGTSATEAGASHAVLFRGGEVVDLGTLDGDDRSSARGINNRGEVVGESTAAGTRDHAFVHRDGQMIRLKNRLDPDSGAGWELYTATAINDAGQIVGCGERDGVPRIFLLTPMR